MLINEFAESGEEKDPDLLRSQMTAMAGAGLVPDLGSGTQLRAPMWVIGARIINTTSQGLC